MEPLSVLLVDDEEDLVTAMAERLALRGFRADVATSAAEALRRLAEKDFNVLIIDVKMPGRGGLRLMSEIKKEHPNLPVILFTGHGSTADAARGMQEGAFDYLMKPVQVDQLIETIRNAASATKGSCS